MFLFSCLSQRIPFTPDFLISLINARFYWHISSASCHRHQKLWNVRSLCEPPLSISTHLQRELWNNSPRLLTCFLNTVPLHTGCICFLLRREAGLITLPFPPREMYVPHTDDTNLLINKLPKRYKFVLHNQQGSCSFFFIPVKREMGRGAGCEWWRGLFFFFLAKRVGKHLQGRPRKRYCNWSPKVMYKWPAFE